MSKKLNIAFDAKRAFQNKTGLGNYSRTLIESLALFFPANQYFLFAPRSTEKFDAAALANTTIITPQNFFTKLFKNTWRRKWSMRDVEENGIHLYHGLSHRIPKHNKATKTKFIVTIHDLIFERYPRQYSFLDRMIYRKQFKYACSKSTAIIAISEQTKNDLISFYKVSAERITVCYQSCNPIYSVQASAKDKEEIRRMYELPERYFLNVGSIIERKNLLTVCKAMLLLKGKLSIPLVVIGEGKKYKIRIKRFISENNLNEQVIFLSENEIAKTHPQFKNSTHFPAIYQMAEALIYPSTFEGFGIPILEAMCSKLPVITSNVSCMPEAGGDGALYVDPFDEKDIADKIFAVATNNNLAESLKEKGWLQAQKFTREKCATAVMQVYKTTINES